MTTNNYRLAFLKKFMHYLMILGAVLLIFLAAKNVQVGQQVLAQTVGACEFYPDEGWFSFLGGDAGDDNNWEPCEPDSDPGTSPQAEQPAPQAEAPAPAPEPEQPAVSEQPAPAPVVQCTCDESDQALRCTFQTFTDSCGNVGACSGIKDCSQPQQQQEQQQEQQVEQPSVQCPAGTTLVDNVCQPPTLAVSCPSGTTLINGICQPPVSPPVGPITVSPVTNTITNTITNTNTNTVSGGATTREVVREVPIVRTVPIAIQAAKIDCPAGSERKVKDNVIVCEITAQPVLVAQVAGVKTEAKELPKTGLPALAWGALALIPLGARLKNLFKVKGDLATHPAYFFEERQFKKDS